MYQDHAAGEDVTLLAVSSGASGFAAHESTHVLVISEGGPPERRIPIGAEPILVGRIPPCDVVLGGSSVSRQHCRIQRVGDEVCVADLGSTNGTFVNGTRTVGAVPLQHGAVLQVGTYVLAYERRTSREVEEALAVERDLQDASAYVQMLLPKPIHAGPVRANWLFLPCAQLGGNAFGYRYLDPTVFAGYMLDVAGQGTGAAMHSVAVMNLLRQPAIPGIDLADPASVLGGLNSLFRPEDNNGMFFSIWYFVFDLARRSLRYGSAGRQPGLLVLPGRRDPLLLATNDPAIGLEAEHGFETATTDVPPGSTLYLLSDGASESLDRERRPGEPSRLHHLVRRDASPGMPEPLQIYHDVRHAAGQRGLDGDFSAIAFGF